MNISVYYLAVCYLEDVQNCSSSRLNILEYPTLRLFLQVLLFGQPIINHFLPDCLAFLDLT